MTEFTAERIVTICLYALVSVWTLLHTTVLTEPRCTCACTPSRVFCALVLASLISRIIWLFEYQSSETHALLGEFVSNQIAIVLNFMAFLSFQHNLISTLLLPTPAEEPMLTDRRSGVDHASTVSPDDRLRSNAAKARSKMIQGIKRKRWLCGATASLIVLIQIAVFLAYVVRMLRDPDGKKHPREDDLLYNLANISVAVISALVSVAFFVTGTHMISTLRELANVVDDHPQSQKWRQLIQNLVMVTFVCTFCFMLRCFAFLYRPITGHYFSGFFAFMHPWAFYQIPELCTCTTFLFVMTPRICGGKLARRSRTGSALEAADRDYREVR